MNKWDTLSIIGNISKPMLFLSGRADEIVPPRMMSALYKAAILSEGRELAAFPKVCVRKQAWQIETQCGERGRSRVVKRAGEMPRLRDRRRQRSREREVPKQTASARCTRLRLLYLTAGKETRTPPPAGQRAKHNRHFIVRYYETNVVRVYVCVFVSQGKHNSTCLSRGYYETIKRFVDRVVLSSDSAASSVATNSVRV